MKIGDSIRKAIDDWEAGEWESATLHACNAVDGTAKKLYPNVGSNARFTRLLRENYSVFGPMAAPGIDLESTRWPVRVQRPKAEGGLPDIADVIYGIHRCSHGHGDELPEGFELLPDAAGPHGMTRMLIEQGRVRLSDRVIFGLLVVAVLSPVNIDQRVPNGYYLSLGRQSFPINDWWGRQADFLAVAARERLPSTTLSFGEWMTS